MSADWLRDEEWRDVATGSEARPARRASGKRRSAPPVADEPPPESDQSLPEAATPSQ